MPDLLTHAIVAYAAVARARRRVVALVVLGTVLPDAASVLPGLVLVWMRGLAGFEIGQVALDGWTVFHAPVPVALLAWLLAFLRPQEHRWRFLAAVILGAWIHLGLDFLQFHLAGAMYRPFYPFSVWRWEAGWIGTEHSLLALPLLIPVALLIWRWRSMRRLTLAPPPAGLRE